MKTTVNQRIKILLEQKRLSKSAFSRDVEITPTYVSSLIREVSPPKPGADLLEKIVKVYLVNPAWLLTGEGEMTLTETNDLKSKNEVLEKEIAALKRQIDVMTFAMAQNQNAVANFNLNSLEASTKKGKIIYMSQLPIVLKNSAQLELNLAV